MLGEGNKQASRDGISTELVDTVGGDLLCQSNFLSSDYLTPADSLFP